MKIFGTETEGFYPNLLGQKERCNECNSRMDLGKSVEGGGVSCPTCGANYVIEIFGRGIAEPTMKPNMKRGWIEIQSEVASEVME